MKSEVIALTSFVTDGLTDTHTHTQTHTKVALVKGDQVGF